MSKKVLTSMKDENPDVQKQMGCISRFFQLFDRQWFFTGQRTSSHNQNNAPPDGTRNDATKELTNTMQKATEKNVKFARENQQFSTESSVNSLSSSSCSSSTPSLEFNRTIQVEAPSASQIKNPGNPNSGAAVRQLDNPGHQSLDFYDIVKDSMQREAPGLSVKTAAKEEKKGRILKYIDSPRPLQAPESSNAAVMVANEPFYVPAKCRKTPLDSPRHSYDGRDLQNILKGATKHKEIARLSLDGREGSIKGFNESTKSQNLLKAAQKGYGSSTTMLRQQEEPETTKRPSSVVAKLMGLDAFSDRTQTCDTSPRMSSCGTNRNKTSAKSSMSDGYNQHQSPVSPVTSKGFSLVMSRRDDASITDVPPYSRFSLEPIPWKHPDPSQDSQLQVSKRSESSTKSSNRALSVYGQIEKRVADLQFKNSGTDLRALKQILEAMERYKDSLDSTREQASNYPSDRSLSESSKSQSPRIQQKEATSFTGKMPSSTQGSKLPIVIMKPAQVTIKNHSPGPTEMSIHDNSGHSKFCPGDPINGRLVDKLDRQTAKGMSPTIRRLKDPFNEPFQSAGKSNKMRNSKLMQSSKVLHDVKGENTTNSSQTAETRSPRVQKKFSLERRSPPSLTSDSNSNRRQDKQLLELSSSCTKHRRKKSTSQQQNERFSKIMCQRRDFKHEVDVISSDFDSNRSMDSHSDTETIQIDRSKKNNSISSLLNGLNQNNATKEPSKESKKAETTVTAEQPSPVSVLDAEFYIEDPPSPIKKKLEISKDLDGVLTAYDSSEEIWEYPLSTNTTRANLSNGTSDNDFQTQNFVQILQQNDSNDQKFTNSRECKDPDPDHKYISEILVASGLLSSPSSSQAVHSSGHLINPKLFHALEQIKTNRMHFNVEQNANKIVRMNNPEKMQRKLIFDVVNDILLQKLILESSSTLWCLPNQPTGHKLNGQKVLDELCRKIDELQHKNRNVCLANEDENLTSLLWRDLMHHPTIWTECNGEIPYIVLGIERLIFKDLITEVARGEVANHPGKHCRQLQFPK